MNFINKKLKEYGIPKEELNRYNESHRFYHNMSHISDMIDSANNKGIMTDDLFLAIIFHDIIYDPKVNDNEGRSAKLLWGYAQNYEVKEAILETRDHKPKTRLGKQLCDLDTEILYGDFDKFIDFEHKIFKEYQWADYLTYKEKRIEILSRLCVNPEYINYVKYRNPKIALYAGSFNPFSKGHYNILEKAECVFDKVIIAKGVNLEKNNQSVELPMAVQGRQIENYEGLLTDFINSFKYDITLVRGLRNATDLQYELTQYRFLQDLSPNIKVVSFFCDREYEHVSSSAIRNLELYNKEERYLL